MRAMSAFVFVGLLAFAAHFEAAEPVDPKLLSEFEKCSVCKVLAEKPALLSAMTWETHKIDNGMLCVATVPKEQAKDFAAINEKMMRNVAKVKADEAKGVKVSLCSFCEGMADLNKAGAKQQEIPLEVGFVSLVTSAEPAVVKRIHAQADRAIAEQKKLKEQNPAN